MEQNVVHAIFTVKIVQAVMSVKEKFFICQTKQLVLFITVLLMRKDLRIVANVAKCHVISGSRQGTLHFLMKNLRRTPDNVYRH